jgi:transcriptional regulator with XRE-family HTH domain
MKLDAKHLREEMLRIMDEDGLSAEELATKAGRNSVTIYRILNLHHETAQRSIGRDIAAATGREFKITGDKIYFEKKDTADVSKFNHTSLAINTNSITQDDLELLHYLKELGIKDKGGAERMLGLFRGLTYQINRLSDKKRRLVAAILSTVIADADTDQAEP